MMLAVFSFLILSRTWNAFDISYDRSVLLNDLGCLSFSADLGNLCILLLLGLKYVNAISLGMDITINIYIYIFDSTDGYLKFGKDYSIYPYYYLPLFISNQTREYLYNIMVISGL